MKDSKPWYTSRTIYGAVASIIGGMAMFVGIEFDVTHWGALTDALVAVGTIVGGIIAVAGRTVADKRIK